MKTDQTGIEHTLGTRLDTHLGKAEISRLAHIIATLVDKGIRIDDAFPYGLPGILDSISIRGNLDAAQLAQMVELVPTLGLIKDFRVFPRGIVAPEGFRMHLNVLRSGASK